jgi:hypothetical protein
MDKHVKRTLSVGSHSASFTILLRPRMARELVELVASVVIDLRLYFRRKRPKFRFGTRKELIAQELCGWQTIAAPLRRAA